MTVSKTKAKLVDVARQLFAKMGVENTTMNDIALASKKGRRTLYTYFKSKEDIYLAVVESELDILSDMMKHVVEKDIQPDEKLMEMIYTHLDAVKEVVFRNGTLRANFFRDIWRVEKVRKRFDATETQLFKDNSALKSNRVIAPVDYLQKERVERQYYLEKKELKRLGLSSQSSDSLFESNIKLCCDRTFEENYLSEFIKDNIDGFIIKSCFYDGYIIENNALYLNDPANWTVGYSGKCFDFEVDF